MRRSNLSQTPVELNRPGQAIDIGAQESHIPRPATLQLLVVAGDRTITELQQPIAGQLVVRLSDGNVDVTGNPGPRRIIQLREYRALQHHGFDGPKQFDDPVQLFNGESLMD